MRTYQEKSTRSKQENTNRFVRLRANGLPNMPENSKAEVQIPMTAREISAQRKAALEDSSQ